MLFFTQKEKIQTLVFKTRLKTIGVDFKNGLSSALFGHLEEHWMKEEEKYLTLCFEIFNRSSQEITLFTIIILIQTKINGKVGKKKLTI